MHAPRIVWYVLWVPSAPPHLLKSSWPTVPLNLTLSKKVRDGTNTSQHFCVVNLVDTVVEHPVPVTPAAHEVEEAMVAIGSLKDEVRRVVTSLPNNQALGKDMIPAELWKAGCEVTCNELTLIL